MESIFTDCETKNNDLSSVNYWEHFYQNELKNFLCSQDIGEIWFGKSNMNKVIKWISECSKLNFNSGILDIGTGNGVLLYNLGLNGYNNLTGFDFSPNAIKLSKAIAEHYSMKIKYELYNVLELPESAFNNNLFDVILDKGTFDAITLGKNSTASILLYKSSIKRLLSQSGLLIIISCNWTKQELETIFMDEFQLADEISTPVFTFGSKEGHTVTSLIFEKKVC